MLCYVIYRCNIFVISYCKKRLNSILVYHYHPYNTELILQEANAAGICTLRNSKVYTYG